MRKPILILILMTVFWQGLAFAGNLHRLTASGDLAHTMAHLNGTGHHHDGAGLWYEDDDDTGRGHVLLDDSLNAPVLCPQAPDLSHPSQRHDLPRVIAAALIVHDGDALRRPPRSVL